MIIRSKVTSCDMTQTVIDRVEQMAKRQGYVTLKFLKRVRETDVSEHKLLAGVRNRQNLNAPILVDENENELPPLMMR